MSTLPRQPLPVEAKRWRVRQWGSFAVRAEEGAGDLTPRGRKARAILAYLVSQPGTRVSRERIAELLWGDRGEVQARASLRQALLEIRHATGDVALVESDRDHLWISDERIIDDSDADDPELPLFDDLNHITPEFDSWLAVERARRSEALLAEFRRQAEQGLAEGRGAETIALIDRMARLDPFDETILCLAMEAEFQAHRPAAIERRFKEMEKRTRDELGVALSSEARALHDRLLMTPVPATGGGEASDADEVRQADGPIAQPVPRWRAFVPWVAIGSIVLSLLAFYFIAMPRWGQPDTRTLAVLPFRALGDADAFVVDGFSEELLSDLSRDDRLKVTGRTSAWLYKNRAADLRRVGKELRVDYVVEGSVRKEGNRHHVTAALVDTRDGSTVWSRRYSALGGLSQPVQSSIGGGILGALGLQQPAAKVSTAAGGAYPLYLRAKGLVRDRSSDGMASAVELLRQAVRVDPGYAPAWALLGGAIQLRGYKQSSTAPNWRDQALAATQRALRLDPALADAHAMRALVLGFDTDQGRAHLRRAYQLEPNNPQVVYWWGSAAGLASDHRTSAVLFQKAAALDPLWIRPVEAAAKRAIEDGDQPAAQRYIRVMKRGNPDAAMSVELSVARTSGDLSRVVQLYSERSGRTRGSTKSEYCFALITLGYARQCVLIADGLPEAAQTLYLRQAPTGADLLQAVRASADDEEIIGLMSWELLRTGRHRELAALYDQKGTRFHDLGQIREGNRWARINRAGRLAVALQKVGRGEDAARLWRAANEGASKSLASGPVPPGELVDIAGNEAAQGRREKAIGLLQQASVRGWFYLDRINGTIDEDPMFASLRGDPRFRQIVARSRARLEREKEEVRNLNLLLDQ